ncbi:S-adenosyl-L-methionine-dependent methyltransferase [Lojkania enalia]|uniref:DNA (cytosine-5-)-methyltransferase n=1 Tax=Lojkania enalia TaxID=147567 RepID=A0A9P4KG50_9PLEO|nr:S-adenosyl-L-methionine-dependent methyltransferase [Didymosphaeria enalia]
MLDSDDLASHLDSSPNERRRRCCGPQVQTHARTYPASICENFEPPLPKTPEAEAIRTLKRAWLSSSDVEGAANETSASRKLVIFELSEFSFYEARGQTLEWNFSLLSRLNAHHLGQAEVCSLMSFSGILSSGACTHYLQHEYVDAFSIEGYDDSSDPTITAFIQTEACRSDPNFDIWYRLRRPNKEYYIYHHTFLWIAQFGKHFVDYLGASLPGTISLHHFREHFSQWLDHRFIALSDYTTWRNEYGKTDYRQAVNAYLGYLYNQAGSLDDAENLLSHHIWADCGSSSEKLVFGPEKTIVTPYVYQFFKDLYFHESLEVLAPDRSVQLEMGARKAVMGFPKDSRPIAHHGRPKPGTAAENVIPGDFIGLRPERDGRWKTEDTEWFAYVQRTERDHDGDLKLFLIYLYRPSDTTILDATYPIDNELFFSDNCNCDFPAYQAAVTRKLTIEWNKIDTHTDKEFFVRHKYLSTEHQFVTLQRSDFTCSCNLLTRTQIRQKHRYRKGDCVYFKSSKRNRGQLVLEPAVIERFCAETDIMILRRLPRLKNDCADMLSSIHRHEIGENELVWSDEFVEMSYRRISRRCSIRFFATEDVLAGRIPHPYNRGGIGDYWVIALRLDGETLVPIHVPFPGPINEGFEPTQKKAWEPYRGLSLFSGGGNLDRGLEEGGGVVFEAAIDASKEAILTHKANSNHAHKLKTHQLSVNTVMRAILHGKAHDFPRIGEVGVAVAGSPCPGFSMLQKFFLSKASLRNASLVTTFLSFVDIYRPEYGVLENVVNMARIGKAKKGSKVFSSIISCLVAMGYQVKQFVLDAWNYSSIQRRSRIFLCIAAPGLTPMEYPHLTHAHYNGIGANNLGTRLPNGEKFAQREDCPTPFHHRTASEANSDLPDIGSGIMRACIPFPDHRLAAWVNARNRAIIERIPFESSFVTALSQGIIPEALSRDRHTCENHKQSKRFKRIKGDGLVPTITTTLSPQDSRTGEILHWTQPRPISVMEARRTQGIPDDEVIIGTPEKQLRIIGNGVDRNVSFVLGLALRKAIESNHERAVKGNTNALTCNREMADLTMNGDDGKLDDLFMQSGVDSTLHVGSSRDLGWTDSLYAKLEVRTANRLPRMYSHTSSSPLPVRSKRSREDSSDHMQSEGHLESRKRTRNSGLHAEYTPASWNKVVEKEVKKHNIQVVFKASMVSSA